VGYDQHWDQSAPGSVAGEDWFENILDKRMQELDPDRTIASDYPNLEVIVIDDGSNDTSELVSTYYSGDPRVRLFRIPNGGKAAALNCGLKRARGHVVVTLDADAHFEKDAISKLGRWFEDPGVGAVAGNAKVGNRVSMITRWQALEYVTSQNLERRALAALGCITVVPGAPSAHGGGKHSSGWAASRSIRSPKTGI
jgi:cellulose synthase/poly-beta-1,6-N-acetylglucosamine synthase-like glycosyltransferase